MGPYAVRVAGLAARVRALGYDVTDDGNVEVKLQEQIEEGDPRARFLPQIAATCEEVAQRVTRAVDDGELSIVVGGDHSIAIGSLAGLMKSHRARNEKLGLLWFDAHADFNTPETTTSGNIHGMPFAALLGYGDPALVNVGGFPRKFDPRTCVLIGGRDIEPKERAVLKEAGIHAYTMRDIDERGMAVVMREALAFAADGTAGIAASIDMDGFDPEWCPGVGTPVMGGMTFREAHLAMEMIADSGQLRHLDLVEINPLLDYRNQTSERGVELILSALGKQIL